MLLVPVFVILCIHTVRGDDFDDCTTIKKINCMDLYKIKHCLCSCITTRFSERRHVDVDFSQCKVFLRCMWVISAHVHLHNDSGAILRKVEISYNNSNDHIARRVNLEGILKDNSNYSIEVYTKCKICDDSCQPIEIDVPKIWSTTEIKSVTETDKPLTEIMIPLYTLIIPGVICICIILGLVLYKKRNNTSNHMYHNANTSNNHVRHI